MGRSLRAPEGATVADTDEGGAELARRRRFYVAGCALGFVAVTAAWGFLVARGHGTRGDAILDPGVALGLAVATALLVRGRARIERIELLLLATAAVGVIGKVADVLFFVHAPGHHDIAPYSDVLPWLPIVPVLGAVVFHMKSWLKTTALFLAVVAVLAAVHVLPGLGSGETADETYVLGRALLANVLVVLLLATGARFHAGVILASARADAMRTLALTDELTEIPNRRSIRDSVRREISRSRRYRRELTVMIFDIDHFKRVNDTHGHAEGDRVLRAIAACVRTSLRGSDLLGRWGGEEFLVVAPETGAAGAAHLAEKLRAAVEALAPGGLGVITASWGVATLAKEDTVETLLEHADAALYEAKSAGRNRVVHAPHARGSDSVGAPPTADAAVLEGKLST